MDKKSGAIYLYQCGELNVMKSTQGKHQGPWGEIKGAPKGTPSQACVQHPDWSQYHT